jgi:putative transposase
MVLYRRNRVAGGTYFFTVTLRDRTSDVLVRHVDLLRDAFRSTRAERPFTVDAIVVLPDHLHALWTLPEDDADYSGRWRAIKARFTHNLRDMGFAVSRDDRGEYRLWQRRFWEHTIRDDLNFQRHADYIHWNPVKHGWVSHPADWPHSSFHRFVRRGLLSPDWSGGVAEAEGRQFEPRSPVAWMKCNEIQERNPGTLPAGLRPSLK